MNWEAMGEVVGAIAVVFTLAYQAIRFVFYISLAAYSKP